MKTRNSEHYWGYKLNWISFVNAEIRYELPDVYTDKVVINKGEAHELAVGYPVITARGILGQLEQSLQHLCRTYISFRLERISASLSLEVIGITKGQGNRAMFELQYVDISAQYKVGDEAVTKFRRCISP